MGRELGMGFSWRGLVGCVREGKEGDAGEECMPRVETASSSSNNKQLACVHRYESKTETVCHRNSLPMFTHRRTDNASSD